MSDCNPMNCSLPGFSVIHCLPEFVQTHVPRVSNAIQPSHLLSPSSCPQSFLALGSFPVSWLFTSGGHSIGASASASVISVTIQGWFRIDWFDLLDIQGTLQESSPAPQFESINSLVLTQASLWFNSHIHTWLLEKT